MSSLFRTLAIIISTLLLAAAVAFVDWPMIQRSEIAFDAKSVARRFGLDSSDLPVEIEARGEGFRWSFRYPGPDRKLMTSDDVLSQQELHIPAGVAVQLILESNDYLYFLSCPSLRLKEIAMRGLTHRMDITSVMPEGRHPIKTDPMCGYRNLHEDEMGTIVIQSPESFAHWGQRHIANQPYISPATSGSAE